LATKAAPTTLKKVPGGVQLGYYRNPIGVLRNAAKRWGDVCYVDGGRYRLYVVSHPDYINEVLVTNHKSFAKGSPRTKRVLGEGLLTSDGDFHHGQRRMIQPAFHQNRIASYAKIMTDFTDHIIGEWKDGEVLDIHREMSRITMAIVAKCLFDADVEAESRAIGKELSEIMVYFNRLAGPLGLVMDRLPLPSNKKFREAVQRLDETVYGFIRERRESGRNPGDLLSMLLSAQDAQGGLMSDKQVRDEAMTLFLAGHETTANALTWAWYLISQNPTVGEKLHDEVVDALPGGRLPTVEDIHRLPFTSKVFTEAIRLYPPAWAIGRHAVKDSAIGGFFIPAGSTIVLSQYVTQHDPRFYDDPEAFKPERWTPEMENKLPDFAYFPFGGGPRGCVGESFAKMEGIVILSTIARKWRMEHASGHKVKLVPRITLRPKYGMQMKVTRRLAGTASA